MNKISLIENETRTGAAAPRRPRYGDDWRLLAACRDLDTELFFGSGLAEPAVAQQELAKAICSECPVRTECLEFALLTGQQFGVWGGATEDERREIRRARRRAARRTVATAEAVRRAS